MSSKQSPGLPWEQLCQRFSLAEIQSATQNFDEEFVIGRGGFGKVYSATIEDTSTSSRVVTAAIKRLDSRSEQGATEFWVEIEMLSKLRHCHLVSLIGYCNDEKEMILVYELMPHGTLADHLFEVGSRLSWLQRLKICLGAARGLDYLHTGTGTHHGVIHRDVKSTNILLDDKWEAKISDFGLSKVGPTNQSSTFVSTAVKGTLGYLDPEYFSSGRLTRKSDVYAFGVVLLEVLCGRRAVDRSLDENKWGLVAWVQDGIKRGKLVQIIDSSLRGQVSMKCSKQFALIAQRCLHKYGKDRPTMAEVVVGLEFALALQERSDHAATSDGKLTFTRKIQKFFSSTPTYSVDINASLSRKNENKEDGKSHETFSDDNLVMNEGKDISQEMAQSAQIATPMTPHTPSGLDAGLPVTDEKQRANWLLGFEEWQIGEEPAICSPVQQRYESIEKSLVGPVRFGSNDVELVSSGNKHFGTALYDFFPGGDDELHLTVGDELEIEYEVEGWYYVKKTCPGRDGKMAGLVPVLYVSQS